MNIFFGPLRDAAFIFFYFSELRKSLGLFDRYVDDNRLFFDQVSPKTVKRLRYYNTYFPIVAGSSWSRLRGKKLTDAERGNLLLLSSFAPLFDDYFDESDKAGTDYIRSVIAMQDTRPANSGTDALAAKLFKDLMPEITQRDLFLSDADVLFSIQIESQRQKNKGESAGFIKEVGERKGAYSLYIYRDVLDNPVSGVERDIMRVFGVLLQYMDDILDADDDRAAGLNTLVYIHDRVETLETEVETHLALLKKHILNSGFEEKNKNHYLKFCAYFFALMTAHLALWKKEDQNILSLTRKQLVLDIHKFSSKILYLREVKRLKNKFS